jgi:hypothetical protein
MVVLHEKLVSIYDMFGEVPREHLIQRLGCNTKERGNDARLKVRPDPCLHLCQRARYSDPGDEEARAW